MTLNQQEGDTIARKISTVAKKYLGVDIDYLGCIPNDSTMTKRVIKRQAASSQNSQTISGQAWNEIAKNLIASFDSVRGYLDWNSLIEKSKESV